ncbi:ring finger domain-containing protein [Fusarium heterosporum]|uniref:Ring finger domain-containing protein n=1 Tax=Fusarium heterosporum TaxID=42747 RepID=A0A8H5WHL1_FUSHE|nr:ring finger domain-containing protein [Fusarium heterosporum]
MAQTPEQDSFSRLLTALRPKLFQNRFGTRDSSAQSSIELQESHELPLPSIPLPLNLTPAVTLTPAESSTLAGSSTLAKSSTAAGTLTQTESLPKSSGTAHQNSGFRVNGPPQNTRSRFIKHAGSNNFCPACGKRYTHTTADYNKWLNSEQIVYLCCGHAFGASCIEEYLAGLNINGQEHRCPMGGCTSIQHECSHITIPLQRPPQGSPPSMDSTLIPSNCESCSTAEVTKLHTSMTQHHGKMAEAGEKLRLMTNTAYGNRLEWKFQKKWHNWKLNRAHRKIDAQHEKHRKHRLDESKTQWFLWYRCYLQPAQDMSPQELETLRRRLINRPDQDVPLGLPLDKPENIPKRHLEGLNRLRKEPSSFEENNQAIGKSRRNDKAEERTGASTEDKGKGTEMVRAEKETKAANAPTLAPVTKDARTLTEQYPSMAEHMMRDSWNDPPPEPLSQTCQQSLSSVPKKVTFEEPSTGDTRPLRSPGPADLSNSLVRIIMGDAPDQPRQVSERLSGPSSSFLTTGQNSSYVNRRVDIGPEVLNHEEERLDPSP